MHLSFSKTIAKFGGFRIGLRVTKKNAAWMLIVMMFVWMFQLMWYMMILGIWLMYVIFYGIYWCIKKLLHKIKKIINTKKDEQKLKG